MRIVVKSWDENNIYGTNVDGNKQDVTIPYNIQNAFGNWQYIGKLLSEGSRLNIVEDELFIFEPDCLVDISSVAGCFEDYGVNPYNYLLSKLRPAANNRYIMLGNLAGQMLEEEINFNDNDDDTLRYDDDNDDCHPDGGYRSEAYRHRHRAEGRPTYAETITRFFHRNALSFATCPDLNNADPQIQKATVDAFHKEARQQQQNIRGYILGGDLFQQHYFDINKVLLEPTFVCEELGIQGRMDLVQSDLHLLIEQKSGSKNRRTNSIQLKHHVQAMLYFAVLHYSHGIRFGECSCSLLYSRYPGAEGIVKAKRSPELLFQALMIRNQIVWNEFCFSRPDGIRILDRITPDKLRRGEPDRNWYQYTEPELSALLAPVHEASMLARSYFYRMFQFVQKENLLSKMGNETPPPGRAIAEAGGFALTWLCSLAEKREAGNIYDSMQLLSHTEDSVTLALDTSITDSSSANFRVGDSVILYKYKRTNEPDARRAILLRASITHLNAYGVELSLSNAQRNAIIFATDEDECWAIEHDYMDSSYTALYRGLFASLSMSKDRSQLLLSQRRPRRTVSRRLRGDYGRFNALVEKCLQADDYAIIIGPPGTGKTSFGMLNVLKEHLEDRGEDLGAMEEESSNVLIVSFTNRAVEEVCSKLVEESIDFIRLGNIHACSEAYRPYMLSCKAEACATVGEVKRMVKSTRVFVSTTSSISNNPSLFRIKHFNLCIVDEASQILEPHLMALIAAQQPDSDAPAIDKFVFIGDHKQLPAVVQQAEEESEVQEKELRAIGLTNCRLSLFERLLRNQTEWMAEEGLTLDDSPFVFRLNRQGRMHPEVSSFANEEFYEGNLMPVPLPHQQGGLSYDTYDASDACETMLATCRTRFIDVKPTDDSPSDKVNMSEAREVARIVVAAYALYARCGKPFVPEQTLGIIVPYRNQISAVRGAVQRECVEKFGRGPNGEGQRTIDVAKAQKDLLRLSIDTVERYQGSQRDIILYSFTIRAPYQLDFLTSNTFVENGCVIDRKLNVALTRAREQMFLVGNKKLLSQNEVFRKLINRIC